MTARRRAPGTGRIYKPKRCRFWYVRYVDAAGNRRVESTRSEKRSDAERLLRDRLGRRDRGELVIDARRVTFDDLVSMIKTDYELKRRRSTERLETSLKHLTVAFGGRRAMDITTDRITAYAVARTEDGAAPASVAKELAALRRMFTLAVRAGRLAQRPYIEMPAVNNARQGFFDDDEFAKVLAELPPPLRPPIEFAKLTGWRCQSEVLPLTWSRVDFAAGIVRLEPGTTKNDEGREFPFAALPALDVLLRAQRDRTTVLERASGQIVPWVFHRDGRRIVSYRYGWQAACERAGCPGRLVHDLRRTAVRNLERAGVPRSVAMKLTGHKTEAIYRRYAIVSPADLREGVAKLAALVPAPEGARMLPFPDRKHGS